MVIFVLISHMKVTGSAAKLLFCQPLAAQSFIFLLTAAFLCLVSFPLSLMVAFNPFRRRMAHTVGFAVMITADIAVGSRSVFICGNHITENTFLRFWRHAVYINLSCASVRISLLIAVFIDLTEIKGFPYVKLSLL